MIVGMIFFANIFSRTNTTSQSTTSAVPSSNTVSQHTKSRGEKSICDRALTYKKTHWESNSVFAEDVQEAQRRGLTISGCRRILGVTQSTASTQTYSTGASSDEDLMVGQNSLSADKTQWENNPTKISAVGINAVIEARRRGLTISDCRSILGVTQSTASVEKSQHPVSAWVITTKGNVTYTKSAEDPSETFLVVRNYRTSGLRPFVVLALDSICGDSPVVSFSDSSNSWHSDRWTPSTSEG